MKKIIEAYKMGDYDKYITFYDITISVTLFLQLVSIGAAFLLFKSVGSANLEMWAKSGEALGKMSVLGTSKYVLIAGVFSLIIFALNRLAKKKFQEGDILSFVALSLSVFHNLTVLKFINTVKSAPMTMDGVILESTGIISILTRMMTTYKVSIVAVILLMIVILIRVIVLNRPGVGITWIRGLYKKVMPSSSFEVSQESLDHYNREDNKYNSTKFRLQASFMVAVLLVGAGFVNHYNNQVKVLNIDLFDYVDITFDGVDGAASAKLAINKESIDNSRINSVVNTTIFTTETRDTISNGEKIKVKANYSPTEIERNKVNVDKTITEYTVNNIPKTLETADDAVRDKELLKTLRAEFEKLPNYNKKDFKGFEDMYFSYAHDGSNFGLGIEYVDPESKSEETKFKYAFAYARGLKIDASGKISYHDIHLRDGDTVTWAGKADSVDDLLKTEKITFSIQEDFKKVR